MTRRLRWGGAAVAAALIGGVVFALLRPDASHTPVAPTLGDIDGIPVVVDDMGGPGTDLGGGFVVPDGAHLLGVPFPNGQPFERPVFIDEGWTAFMLVPGDPRPVVADFVSQALSVGIEAGPRNDPLRGSPLCSAPAEAHDLYQCKVVGEATDGSTYRFIDLDFSRGIAGVLGSASSQPVSHLRVTYGVRPPDTRFGPCGEACEPVVGAAANPDAAPITDGWTLPGVGEEFGAEMAFDEANDYGVPPLVVEPGSRLVAPLFTVDPDTKHTFGAVLRVVGDPDEVWNGYTSQIHAISPDGNDVVASPLTLGDGVVLRRDAAFSAGGEAYELWMVELPDGTAWLRIETWYD